MDDLKKQIQILIDKAEQQRLYAMAHSLTYENNYHEGSRDALKLVKLLIDTNLSVK